MKLKQWLPLGLAAPVALAAALGTAVPTYAQGGGGTLRARLIGYEEVPAISTTGRGRLQMDIARRGDAIEFELRYEALEAPVLFAHIHLGQPDVNGGVIAFFCGGGSKPACPSGPEGTVRGTITAADVVGPAAQGIAPGELAEVLRALRAGVVYANVHTQKFPGGEIRGQVGREADRLFERDALDQREAELDS